LSAVLPSVRGPPRLHLPLDRIAVHAIRLAEAKS
jgi:hypothetical protein